MVACSSSFAVARSVAAPARSQSGRDARRAAPAGVTSSAVTCHRVACGRCCGRHHEHVTRAASTERLDARAGALDVTVLSAPSCAPLRHAGGAFSYDTIWGGHTMVGRAAAYRGITAHRQSVGWRRARRHRHHVRRAGVRHCWRSPRRGAQAAAACWPCALRRATHEPLCRAAGRVPARPCVCRLRLMVLEC